ncbi:hypothetical protein NDI44_27575 [Trichocoleus sp. DQ-A3]|uniref:hypothetical protein n=1 Tax=Cyanophyceae TaxID=3028117 RepID=UPI001686C070|nr:hypothetical protein [Coleofasciculus sp. FACHB-125]MBD1903632.1 hypothetical protein [Coleofasciculus sp. FACHB-125]
MTWLLGCYPNFALPIGMVDEFLSLVALHWEPVNFNRDTLYINRLKPSMSLIHLFRGSELRSLRQMRVLSE